MKKKILITACYLVLPLLFSLVSACSKTPAEETILANIHSMQQAAEDKKPRAAVEYLADGFAGNQGVDKMTLRRIMVGLFLRHQNVHVTIPRMDINVNPQDQYSASMEGVVILAGAENILPQDGRMYKVSGDWQYIDGEWMLVRARWE